MEMSKYLYLYLCLTKNYLVLSRYFQVQFIRKCQCRELLEYIIITVTILNTNYRQARQTRRNSGGLQRASQDSTKGGYNNFLLFTR